VRILSSDLLAAQRSASAVPYVLVPVSERIAHTVRLRWERLYTGSEPESHHASTVPSDGSLLRARSTGGQLYYQRAANPGPGSNFSSWTSLASVSATAGLALASRGSSVLLFSVHTDNLTIHVRESADSGATFGSPVTVATASGAVTWMAAALKSDGTALLVYSVGATVYRVKRVNGVWGSPAAWSHSLASVSGLACNQYFDFDIAVAGSQSGGVAGLWTVIYGDGYSQALDTWSPLMQLTLASAGSSVQFQAPSLAVMGRYRLFSVEKYTGSQAYSRAYWTHLAPGQTFVSNTWREAVVMDTGGDFGLAAAAGSGYGWLSTPSGVWRASLSAPVLDLGEDVLEAYADTRPQEGRLRVVLHNDDGRYNDLSGGAYAAIRRGSQVDFSPGYITASGPVASPGARYWIEGWDYVNGRGRALFVLHASDGWALLENWRARRQFTWGAGESTVYALLRFVLGRAGLGFGALSASDTVTSLSPAFTIQPAESGKAAVSRLLAMVPDVLLVSGEYGFLVNPTATQATDYEYGVEHSILEGRYGFRSASFNRVQVFGQSLMVEDFDWTGVGDIYDRLHQAHDRNLTSTAAAQDRADALLRHQEMQADDDEVLVPVNCGQELYDVVEVTDPGAGLSAARRRVLSMSFRYVRNRPTPAYEMRLRLGAV
jgi:hypothetical protein